MRENLVREKMRKKKERESGEEGERGGEVVIKSLSVSLISTEP